MDQVLLISKLRWMLFKNSFRSRGTWLELGAGLVVSVFVLALDLGISILIGVMVYWSYHHQIFVPLLTTVLGVLLAAWHLLPVLTASFSNDLNVSKFRLYPISISKLFAIDLSLGLFDPVTLVLIPPLLAIFIASALRSASSIPIAGFALLIFFIFNLGLSRYVQRLIGTLLASRRRKELFLLLIFLLIMLPQTLVVMGQRESPRARPSYQFQSDAAIKERFEKVKAVAKYLAWVPPGLAAISIGEDRGMHFGRQALSILLALMFTCAALGLEHRALDRDYYGKVSGIQLLVARIRAALGGSAVPGPRSGLKIRGGGGEIAGSATQTAVGQPKSLPSVLERLFPWLAPASIAIFEKDIKYIYRSPRAILMFVAPIIGSLIFVVPGSPLASGSVGAQYRLAGLVLYALVLGSQFFNNCFGFDWYGSRIYFTAPVSGRTVLVGKNFSTTAAVLIQVAVITIAFCALSGIPDPRALVCAILVCGIALPFNMTVGNYLSVMFPRGIDFSKVYGKSYSGISAFIGLASMPFLVLLAGIGPVLGWLVQSQLLVFAILGLEALLAISTYLLLLSHAGRIFEGRAERFLGTLCKTR